MSGVFHDGIGKSSLHEQGTAIRDAVALCIEKTHQHFASCVMVYSQSQAQDLGVLSGMLGSECCCVAAWLILHLSVGLIRYDVCLTVSAALLTTLVLVSFSISCTGPP